MGESRLPTDDNGATRLPTKIDLVGLEATAGEGAVALFQAHQIAQRKFMKAQRTLYDHVRERTYPEATVEEFLKHFNVIEDGFIAHQEVQQPAPAEATAP